MITTKCSSCGASIIWCKTESGKAMPLDAEPVPDGNIQLDSQGQATYMKKGDDERWHNVVRFKSHFATCPNAATHRKKK